MEFDVDKFVAQCRKAYHGRDERISAVKHVMDNALADPASIAHVLPASSEEEILLYQSDDLTIYRVLVFQGLQYPPHEHNIPVIIGLYSGCETNLLYTRSKSDSSRLEPTGKIDIQAPQVRIFKADVIHAVTNLRPEPSAALHIYFGDLSKQRRSLWTLDLDGERQFNEESYFSLARRLVA